MYFRFRLEFRRVFCDVLEYFKSRFRYQKPEGPSSLDAKEEKGRRKVIVVLTKNDDRVIVLSDEPFYVTETVNEGLKNFVNNEVKKGKIMSYCNFFQYLMDIVNECLVNWIPCQCITNC